MKLDKIYSYITFFFIIGFMIDWILLDTFNIFYFGMTLIFFYLEELEFFYGKKRS